MGVRSVHVRRFRSIEAAALSPCGSLNTLVGKNNAGKSNLLSTIELALRQLKTGRLAEPWRIPRPSEQFNNREAGAVVRIGIEFDLPAELNQQLRERLTEDASSVARSVEQIAMYKSIVFVFSAATDGGTTYIFVEQISVGTLRSQGDDLLVDGVRLLSMTRAVALELCHNVQSADSLSQVVDYLEELKSEKQAPLTYAFDQPKESRARFVLGLGRRSSPADPALYRQVETRLNNSATVDEFKGAITELIGETKIKMEAIEKQKTTGSISAYAGDTKVPPAYSLWLMKEFGKLSVLHLREVKRPIGKEEAKTLLDLKVTRGGPQRLLTIQQTVRALMGVNLDAFQPESRTEGGAEMDIDEFVVEVNGAGIKEALRIILDLELRTPSLALIEEPEVHLHPGLARVLATYLREKSRTIQIFVTTHSTDFVDFVSFQNVFLVSRDANNKTVCEAIGPEDATFRIPSELGLKLSTVFMFDHLVFVEGPSDEAVLREFARKLSIDFTKSNVGFVYMQGARNFAHFAAEATLEMLARRRIRMWFILDRDERDDAEVQRMAERFGDRARLVVLEKREIENYLLDPASLALFIDDKLTAAGSSAPKPTPEQIAAVLQTTAAGLRDEVIRLRLEKRLLKPIFLHTRNVPGSIEERIRFAQADLERRLRGIADEQKAVSEQVEATWSGGCQRIAPGSTILREVSQHFGVTFAKDRGDSERLARYISPDAIPSELMNLLSDIARE